MASLVWKFCEHSRAPGTLLHWRGHHPTPTNIFMRVRYPGQQNALTEQRSARQGSKVSKQALDQQEAAGACEKGVRASEVPMARQV